jgi:hypothetical protein
MRLSPARQRSVWAGSPIFAVGIVGVPQKRVWVWRAPLLPIRNYFLRRTDDGSRSHHGRRDQRPDCIDGAIWRHGVSITHDMVARAQNFDRIGYSRARSLPGSDWGEIDYSGNPYVDQFIHVQPKVRSR